MLDSLITLAMFLVFIEVCVWVIKTLDGWDE